jgi:FKBP-type peptidyl-prolyl cis-trans isomerase FklB
VLKSYTKADNLKLEEVAHTDCILVDVLPSDFTVEGDKATSPLYTDVTEVHYCGKLLPSLSYSNGYQFDSSYSGSFSEQTAEPVELSPNGTIAGFSTALQHMHRGDHWLITIPYQMGYGVSGSSSIPGYSTLIFEIRMVDFTSDQGNG